MTKNQLPEGVGKKIVEALKRQAEADITPIDESNNVISNSVPLSNIESVPEIQYNEVNEEIAPIEQDDNFIVEEETPEFQTEMQTAQEVQRFVFEEQPAVQETIKPIQQQVLKETYVEKPFVQQQPQIQQTVQPQSQALAFAAQPAVKKEKAAKINSTIQVKMPANVAVLKNLISTLPVGVSKQTGALIIRQTLEAMGLPMNSVLKEAQDVQEELNNSTRECMLKIQEYKTNIMQLEQSVQEYQKNINQINDLVSLFLLTDK